jgi:hypothetical protein
VLPRKACIDGSLFSEFQCPEVGLVIVPSPRDVWSLVAAEAVNDDRRGLGGWLQRLCRATTRELAASGSGVSLMSSRGDPTVVAASSPANQDIEQLQFTLGEGPCWDAYALGQPVSAPDLGDAARTRWPGYAPAARDHGVEAVFAFPLQQGAARIGALDVYRASAGPLSPAQLAQGQAFADATLTALLDGQERAAAGRQGALEQTLQPELEEAFDGRFEVYQAQGMVQVQLEVSLEEALARLRGYAYAHDRPLTAVAADVVARRLTFTPDA